MKTYISRFQPVRVVTQVSRHTCVPIYKYSCGPSRSLALGLCALSLWSGFLIWLFLLILLPGTSSSFWGICILLCVRSRRVRVLFLISFGVPQCPASMVKIKGLTMLNNIYMFPFMQLTTLPYMFLRHSNLLSMAGKHVKCFEVMA